MLGPEEYKRMDMGSKLVRLVLDEEGNFFNKNNTHPASFIDVTPIQYGLNIIYVDPQRRQYSLSFEEEFNFKLATKALELSSEEDVLGKNIGVRVEGCLGINREIIVDFYKIINPGK